MKNLIRAIAIAMPFLLAACQSLDMSRPALVTMKAAGCGPLPANVVIEPVPTTGLARQIVDKARNDGLPPTIYSMPLPNAKQGAVFTTRQPATPPSMTVQISISKCPGDYTFAYDDPSEAWYSPLAPKLPFYPCIALGSAESGAIRWDATLGMNNCAVTSGETWYANMRVTDAKGVSSCPPASWNGPGCPFIYWWN